MCDQRGPTIWKIKELEREARRNRNFAARFRFPYPLYLVNSVTDVDASWSLSHPHRRQYVPDSSISYSFHKDLNDLWQTRTLSSLSGVRLSCILKGGKFLAGFESAVGQAELSITTC